MDDYRAPLVPDVWQPLACAVAVPVVLWRLLPFGWWLAAVLAETALLVGVWLVGRDSAEPPWLWTRVRAVFAHRANAATTTTGD